MINEKSEKDNLSIILPTYNERDNICPLINKLLNLNAFYNLEILVIDDNSIDGTASLVRSIAQKDQRIRLVHRVDRTGLSSAIKEGFMNSTGSIVAVMDSDGQHEPDAIKEAIYKLNKDGLDLVIGSRFLGDSEIKGLSNRRKKGSSFANYFSRLSLSANYNNLTDFMSGCLVMKRESCVYYVHKVDVNGFKFLYELLAVSNGSLKVAEIGLTFQPRTYGKSKLDIAIFWDFLISLLHSLSLRILPRRAISFALVGATGVLVQLLSTEILTRSLQLDFVSALPYSVIVAATSNYLINNSLTFRSKRLKNWPLIKGLLKFLLVASLPVIANVGLATSFYNILDMNAFWSQMAGILVVFIWNYVASSKFVWNTPS